MYFTVKTPSAQKRQEFRYGKICYGKFGLILGLQENHFFWKAPTAWEGTEVGYGSAGGGVQRYSVKQCARLKHRIATPE